MWMASYSGKASRTFGVHNTPELAKKEAELHAVENGRLKGSYTIAEGNLHLGDLFFANLGGQIIKGTKQGKNIIWEVKP